MRKNRICLNTVSRKIPDSLSEDRLMFSSAGAQPISLKSFRGLGHFPNKIAREYKREHVDAPDKSSGKRRQKVHIEYDLVGYIPVDELLKAEQA